MTAVDRTHDSVTQSEWTGGPKIAAVLAVAMLAIGTASVLYFAYVADVPSHPVPATGHTVRISVHGTLRYITDLDWWLSQGVSLTAVFVGVFAKVWQALRERP